MDGTLLDLHFDNKVWNDGLPQAWAAAQGIAVEEARNQLLAHMREIYGTIQFYSFEYWEKFTGLDLTALHTKERALVDYRPGALAFLRRLRQLNKLVVIATNAHPSSIAVKDAQIQISDEVDGVVSNAELNAPKEEMAYWEGLQVRHPFDPARTLFIDDNAPVLDAARDYGIAHLLTIITPDSSQPARFDLSYPAFDDFAEISTGL